jgi:hypothetical protein
MATLPHDFELQAISAPPLIYTIHKSQRQPLSLFQLAVSSPAVPWQRLQQWRLFTFTHSGSSFTASRTEQLNWSSQSQSHIATDDQSISKSWCRAPSAAHDQIFITLWQLRSCFCGAPSLTRGRVCLLCMLVALASVVFFGSDPHIWDFPFRRLLRLAVSRWRHSTPPAPTGRPYCLHDNSSARTT